MAHTIFFRSAAILKVLVGPNRFSNFSHHGHSTSWHIRAREEIKGQMELYIETTIFSEVSVGAFKMWLLPL